MNDERWGEGVILGDGRRYYRVQDLPPDHPLRQTVVRVASGAYESVELHPEMLVARAVDR